MLKPAEGIQIVAHLTGQPLSWTDHTARMLREADLGLWPQVGRGSRSGAVSVPHLVNLLIATAAPLAAPVHAVQTVTSFRRLKLRGLSVSLDAGGDESRAALALANVVHEADGFGSFMDGLLSFLVTDIETRGAIEFADFLAKHTVEVALQSQASEPPITTVLIDRGALITFAEPNSAQTNKQSGDGRFWYTTSQQRLRWTASISWGVLISTAAAYARGRPDFAFLPPDALAAALAPPLVLADGEGE